MPVRSLLCLVVVAASACAVGLMPPTATAAPELRQANRISGSSFLRTFREVVRDSRDWTVRVQRLHPRTERWEAAALGTMVRSDGLIVTKASEAIGTLRVRMPGLSADTASARIVAIDESLDLALLRLDMTDRRPLPEVAWASRVAAGDDPQVGRWVVTPSITSSPAAVGIVSVPRRSIPRTELPGMLGVKFEPQPPGAIIAGGLIDDVVEDGPADRAGMVRGDLILSVAERSTPRYVDVINQIKRWHPGDVVAIRVRHADATSETIRVRLAQPNKQLLEVRGMRYDMMNVLGGKLSERRSNFPAAIQHDSVLDPTDCGGVAVNLDGEAIGLNIARAGRTETLMLPSDVAQVAIAKLIAQADARGPLGVPDSP